MTAKRLSGIAFDVPEKQQPASAAIEHAFGCQNCTLSFSYRRNLLRHLQQHHFRGTFACNKCSKTFSRQSSLNRHSRTHTGEKPFSCKHCSKKFFRKYTLLVHKKIHKNERSFKCTLCTKSFLTTCKLSRHKQKHRAKLFSCTSCPSVFHSKTEFEVHCRTHTFICHLCLLRYSKKRNLVRHVRSKHSEAGVGKIPVVGASQEVGPQRSWSKVLEELDKIVVKGKTWPSDTSVSWETFPKLIRFLRQTNFIPDKFVTLGNHWDPCYLNGNVRKVYREIGLNIRHRREDFWLVWKTVLTPSTFIITNPPFGKTATYWLVAFLEFLATFDRPFLIILPNYICTRTYFHKAVAKIRSPKDLHVWGLSEGFPMKKPLAEKPRNFYGLTVLAYYPKSWNFALDKSKFNSIITQEHLHNK